MLVSNALGVVVLSLAATGFGLPSAPANPLTGGITTQRVKMADVSGGMGKLTCLKSDPLEKEKVEYVTSGKPNYDEVSRSAAEIKAGMVVSNSFADSLTTDLKGYARSYAASQAADESVKEIVGKSKPEELTNEKALALMALKKKRGQLSADEASFALNAATDAVAVVSFLGVSVSQAKPLIAKASGLSQSVKADFTGAEAVKAPVVAKSLQSSTKSLREATEKGPELAKTLARLAQGLKSL
jgi:hypothetical protein